MSVYRKLKLLIQVKKFLYKSYYQKNFHFAISKKLLYIFQKLMFSQIQAVRKYSLNNGVFKVNRQVIKKCNKKNKSIEKIITTMFHKQHNLNQPDQEKSEYCFINVISSTKELNYIPQIFTTLLPKLSVKLKAIPLFPKWKSNLQRTLKTNNIILRTQYILNSIVEADSNMLKWQNIEDLLNHIDQFPEAKDFAINNGIIRILLLIRQSYKDEQIQATIREALAVLGYIDPLPARGIRILTIDGGGIRGILVIQMLKKFEQLTGRKICQIFDYICGVSTGAILSTALGSHKRKSLDEISDLYKKLSIKIFTQSTLWQTSKMVWSHAYYDTALWEKILQEHLGSKDLIKTTRDLHVPKFSAISAIVNHERIMTYVFRNYVLPSSLETQYMGSYKHKLWEAVRASAAAPSYFKEFKCGEYLHQDGGIMANNPCAVAIHEAKQLWPNNPIQCVVSFGTGRAPFSISVNNGKKMEETSSWKDKFYKILDSATDTEAVHIILSDLLPNHAYYRFNPYLTEMLPMVEIRPEKIAQLEEDATIYIRRNEEKFQQAAKVLMQEKTLKQKIGDWVKIQKTIVGL